MKLQRLMVLLTASMFLLLPVSAQHVEHATGWVPVESPKLTPERKIEPFLANSARRIKKLWIEEGYPNAKLICRFQMTGSDSFTNLKIKKSSGSKEIDQAALKCIETARIDRCPKDFVGAVIQIEFTGSGGDSSNGAGPLIYPKWIRRKG